MCGKKLTDGISGLTGSGSPLHVQEKHFEDAVKICIRRITPACAGKTVFLVQMMKHHQDHTRVCGKNSRSYCSCALMAGSPPRVREKLNCLSAFIIDIRITPACAGKTKSFILFLKEAKDHPRVCGKNLVKTLLLSWIQGSPPRVREKLDKECDVKGTTRITPACAGKTIVGLINCPTHKDHPRVCGKNTKRSQ